ncbi:MAG: D-sedoheptulose 7-phosphate isomerase, partial [Pyrinomonadaceae bacterium]
LEEHLELMRSLLNDCLKQIEETALIIATALREGHKVLLCGNGGSAADAQHIAAELVGRFEDERRGWPALALTTDTSALTAVANDYGFAEIFARQVRALATEGDVLIAISTSGSSENIIRAIERAREIKCRTIALTGASGAHFASLCDAYVIVPSSRTARIQEAHGTIGHIWCEIVDQTLAGDN